MASYLARSNVLQKTLDVTAFRWMKAAPPAAKCHRKNVFDMRVPGGNFRERFVHRPIEFDGRIRARGIGERRQRVHDVPHR